MVKGFDVLQKEGTNVQELIAVLDDYAKTGSAIRANVVIEIINKVQMNQAQLNALIASAQLGALLHLKNGVSKEAELVEAKEYAKVLIYLENKL